MFSLLIRKELLEQLLSLRAAMSGVICLVIVLSSTFVLTRDFKEALADYRTNLVMHKHEIEESRDFAFEGINIDKPLNPMQIFFRGVGRELTSTARVSGEREPQFEANFERNPVVFLFPPIDLLFFIGVIMSLLAIAFSYDAISGEKEQGTLKLLMSYSVPRDQVILSKWIGGYLAMILPLIVSLLCGLVIVILFPTVELRLEDWSALGAVLLVALLYLSAIFSLGLFVSARTHLASTSITVLLMAWVLTVLAAPNIAPYIAKQIKPVRSFTLVEREKYQLEREDQQKFDEGMARWSEENPHVPGRWGPEWHAEYYSRRLEQLPRIMDMQNRINEQYHKHLNEQIQLAQNISRLSPFSSFAYAVSDLANTGVRDRNRFMDQLPDYRKEVTVFGLERQIAAEETADYEDEAIIEGYPQFRLEESAVVDRISWVDILILGVWNVVFFMGAYLSFLRYDVM